MRTRRILFFANLLPALAFAQTSPPAPDVGAANSSAEVTAAPAALPGALVRVPALTSLLVRLEEEVSSKRQKPGDHFKIAVAEDVRIGDVVVIPAGSSGEGEVIHVAKAGAGGKAAELILAARFVRVGETEVRLRSFVLGAAGHDNSRAAQATSVLLGPLAMFVHGGAVIVARGTLGSAKTTLDLQLPAAAPGEPPPAQQPLQESRGKEDESKTD